MPGEKHHRHHRHRSHGDKTSKPSVETTVEEENQEEDWNANRQRIELICQTPPNNTCNDCNSNGTRWASVNHGVFLCIRCSGIHRSLGVHVTKIKSTNMDKWLATEVNLMEAIGNKKGKLLYESRLPKGMKPMTGAEQETTLRTFIQQKYQEKAFAVENVNEILRQYYKQTRYGKKPKKSTSGASHTIARGGSAADAGSTQQREETMKALYGVNADAISKKSKKIKPVHGIFGVVNVPLDEYDKRREALLAHFNLLEPSVAGIVNTV
ncbi:ADP-ribosylation factor GTPase activating protein [Trypanosoma theileri]|uniref:ADP-ribosylation factor GTPase activating protein n=1 Tax=Trypanosoma theileri TaxID=67003 RepID=A0A1X0NZE9_9TRYP|nr:ADP-ribosylation factor GTPase activating protein [Trypanosoma theileri]ORC90086.1 ADP-ribosylation factor GTPase activating protein [Trypanosoma theileri]